jgi:diphthine-ammonia ligase
MKIAALISSGKDSMFALYKALEEGHKLACIMYVESKNPDSFMFHTPNVKLVEKQAECLDIPFIKKVTKGEKEKELDDLKELISKAKEKYQIEGVVSGAVHSKYQWNRIDKICGNLELVSIAPLWNYDQEKLVRDIIDAKFEVIIQSIAGDGFDSSWLGRELDLATLEELKRLNEKYGVHIGGEGGEYESLVLDCPLFKKRIKIEKSTKQMDSSYSGRLIISKCKLEIKQQ